MRPMPIFAGFENWRQNTNEAPILRSDPGFFYPAGSPLTCLLQWALRTSRKRKTSNAKPDAGGIGIEPSSGEIAEGSQITITFPVAMVAPDLIDVGNQPPPFVGEPKLDGTFLWKSQTEGVFTVSGVVAGEHHRLTLASGLKDEKGKPFAVKDWSAEFTTPKFAITSDFGEREELPCAPANLSGIHLRSSTRRSC